jgi:hypothetical protein
LTPGICPWHQPFFFAHDCFSRAIFFEAFMHMLQTKY